MGLLFLGTALTWDDSEPFRKHVHEHGITQFINLWNKFKDREGDTLLWGDEVEYMVLSFDSDNKNARLSLRQSEILHELQKVYLDLCNNTPADPTTVPTFHPEYGRYMLESTPGSPYTGSLTDLLSVEKNMRYRRKTIRSLLEPHESLITTTSFPRLGVPGIFTDPHYDPSGAQASHSLFLPDEITNPHVRFPTLTANIRRRRGSKVAINLPIFVDSQTPQPFIDPTIPYDRNVFPEDPEAKNGAALPDHIYLDAMGFGMGCCCLQITFQACNVEEARRVYDALVPVGPIMLALTAASPAYRGYLADVDCRWNVIAGSVDDRTEEERGLKPLEHSKYVIPKSRYDSVDLYLSQDHANRPEYNNVPILYDEDIHQRLTDAGIDNLLAKHVAHLFIRDPLVIFSEAIDLDDENSSDHFENIQSTNWQTLRFKPPPPKSPIGWRVEFRSMEVQITDFENAAFSVFIVLLSRAILSFGLNFYIPISKVDENMQRAQVRDAAREQKFFFRKDIYPISSTPIPPLSHASSVAQTPASPLSPVSSPLDLPAEPTEFSAATAALSTDNHLSNSTIDCHEKHHSASDTTSTSTESHTATSDISPASTPASSSPSTSASKALPTSHQQPASAPYSRCHSPVLPSFGPVDEEYEEMTINEIINGKGDTFPGLLGVVNAYLNSLNVELQAKQRIRMYLDLIKRRAEGSLITMATWMRNYIRSHPDYKFDSVVSQEVNFDLMNALDEIERGVRRADDLLPEGYVGSKMDDGCL